MPLSEAQKTVAQSDARFRTLVAGRRLGKSTLGIREICKFASQPGKVCWAVCPSYRQAKKHMVVETEKKTFSTALDRQGE